MVGVRSRGEGIRQFILDNVSAHPTSIVALTSEKFEISRQAVNTHIQRLVSQKALVAEGNTRNRVYKLHPEIVTSKSFQLLGLEEDLVWREFVLPTLGILTIGASFIHRLNSAMDNGMKPCLSGLRPFHWMSKLKAATVNASRAKT